MRLVVAIVASTATLVGGLCPAGVVPDARAAPSVGVVGCAEHVEAGGPEPSKEAIRAARRSSLIVGAVTLWGLRHARDHAFGPGGPRGDEGWKAALSVRGYRPVTVRVAARDRGWVALDYVRRPADPRARHVADADSAVRFEPCPPGTRTFDDRRALGPQTGWAGGFLVARRGCATLLVRRAGAQRSTPVRVGFGVRCP
jgi:hypothetical protein